MGKTVYPFRTPRCLFHWQTNSAFRSVICSGEAISESASDELRAISEKLEVINLQLSNRHSSKVKTIRWLLISLCAFMAVIFIAFAAINGSYMDWNYNDPELAVAGTILHGFEFVFVRLAPIVFAAAIVGIVMTYKKS